MTQNEQEKYKELLMELYKENQSFLNKAIFGFSTLAIPFLFNALITYKQEVFVTIFTAISIGSFLIVIILQVFSLKYARKGCDKSMDSNDDGEPLFKTARKIDVARELFFILGIIAIIIILVYFSIATIQKENEMSKYKDDTVQPLLAESYTPPKSIKPTNNKPNKSGGNTQKQSESNNKPTKK